VTNQIDYFVMCQRLLADLDSDNGPFMSLANLGSRPRGSSCGRCPNRDHRDD
jgi:hypothetical protein